MPEGKETNSPDTTGKEHRTEHGHAKTEEKKKVAQWIDTWRGKGKQTRLLVLSRVNVHSGRDAEARKNAWTKKHANMNELRP